VRLFSQVNGSPVGNAIVADLGNIIVPGAQGTPVGRDASDPTGVQGSQDISRTTLVLREHFGTGALAGHHTLECAEDPVTFLQRGRKFAANLLQWCCPGGQALV
jgi:hypothetical protein